MLKAVLRLATLAFALAGFTIPAAQAQQDYPTKPVRIIVAFTAGGTTDILARMIGQRMAEKFKQPFIVDNRPGAAGNIGTEMMVRAAPDGYTIGADSVGPISVNPSLFKKLGYNPVFDLAAVAQIADVPNVLVVNPSTGIKNMDDFLKYAKANSGKVTYASTGIGTSSHLSGFLLASRAGYDATHIPYKGAEALNDLLAGRVTYMFATIPSVIGQIRAGKLTAIAVSSTYESRSLPGIPTVAESGFPGFAASSWFGFFAPKDTPRAIVNTLNKAINESLNDKAIEARLIAEGADPTPGSPEQFQQFVRAEYEKWREVVKQSGASAD
jgi:tripartite-type tricarboxylate transporter receptor subunit TctC